MLSNTHKTKDKGFTIIEVLIVLAIAGLILLVVFLAVPALQRNARNTTRKSDVASILAGISEYVNNNDGTQPANQATMGTGNTATIGSSGNTVDVKLGAYKSDQLSSTTTVATANPNDVNKVVIVYGGKCDTTTIGNSVAGGPSRGFVALYTLEPATKLCQAS
ncbi:MAG TPA: type II secretion system protein [Candidatus Saccharimonadales bacterium]|nr:type II secretion system protein [Candidatus Saccharimonadales bacterium]